MSEGQFESIFANKLKHSQSATKLGNSPFQPLPIKVKKEVTVKLNKILVNLQPSALTKVNLTKVPRSANTSIQQNSLMERVPKATVILKKTKPGINNYDNNHSTSTNGFIKVVNPTANKLKVRASHTRSLSNGHFRPVERASINDASFNKYVNVSPVVKAEDPAIVSQPQRDLAVAGHYYGIKAEENPDKNKIIIESSNRSLSRNGKQKSLMQIKPAGNTTELERDRSLPRLQRKNTAREENALLDETNVKSFLKGEESKWRHLIFNVNIDKETLEAHVKLVAEGLNYAIKFLKPPSLSYVESRQVILDTKQKEGQKTLVLDLDETLIRSCPGDADADMILTPEGVVDTKIHIKVRPFAQQFLNIMKDHFEVMVFTASSELYANTIINALDPKKECISYIFHRGFCFETNKGIRIKDLRIFKNRDLKDLIIVDNFVPAFSFQLENGVPILEWVGDKKDKELMYLTSYLLKAKDSDDMREFNKKNLNLLELAKSFQPPASSVAP